MLWPQQHWRASYVPISMRYVKNIFNLLPNKGMGSYDQNRRFSSVYIGQWIVNINFNSDYVFFSARWKPFFSKVSILTLNRFDDTENAARARVIVNKTKDFFFRSSISHKIFSIWILISICLFPFQNEIWILTFNWQSAICMTISNVAL